MIRDKTKIYGEPNDPNTVLAEEVLTTGKLLIGAGNKKVKVLDLVGKQLIYQNSSGIASGFNYNVANKIIGTDANGNLVLKDQVKTIIKNFGGTNNPLDASGISSDESLKTPTIDNTYGDNISTIAISPQERGGTFTYLNIVWPVASQFVIPVSLLEVFIAVSNQGDSVKTEYSPTGLELIYSESGSTDLKYTSISTNNDISFINANANIPIGSTIKGVRLTWATGKTVENPNYKFGISAKMIYTEGGA